MLIDKHGRSAISMADFAIALVGEVEQNRQGIAAPVSRLLTELNGWGGMGTK